MQYRMKLLAYGSAVALTVGGIAFAQNNTGMPFSSPYIFSSTTGQAFITSLHISPAPNAIPNTAFAPTISACGTSPTFNGTSTDVQGSVTTGTGTVTACTLTFFQPWLNFTANPRCWVTERAATVTGIGITGTNTSITLNFAASSPSTRFDYLCLGHDTVAGGG